MLMVQFIFKHKILLVHKIDLVLKIIEIYIAIRIMSLEFLDLLEHFINSFREVLDFVVLIIKLSLQSLNFIF
jgi:hypothetical protein